MEDGNQGREKAKGRDREIDLVNRDPKQINEDVIKVGSPGDQPENVFLVLMSLLFFLSSVAETLLTKNKINSIDLIDNSTWRSVLMAGKTTDLNLFTQKQISFKQM